MSRRALIALAIAMFIATAIFLATPNAFWRASVAPTDIVALGRWIGKHPTDYTAASAVTESSLDLDMPRRVALWHAAYELAHHAAPYRPNAAAAFTRAGLAHWYELAAADRAAVLRALEPLLRDPQFFAVSWRPVWEVTGNVSLLRRANPGSQNALTEIAQLAVANGRFDDYRALRDALERKRLADFQEARRTATPAEMVNAFPEPPYHVGDEPLLRALLDELHRRPLDERASATKIAGVVDYALRHRLEPLDGLESAIRDNSLGAPVRARLALHLGRPDLARNIELSVTKFDASWHDYFIERTAFEEQHGDRRTADLYRTRRDATTPPEGWAGLCERDICSHATAEIRGPRELTVEPVQSDDVPAYVEVYVDDRRAGESPIRGRQTFAIGAGEHRVEIDLVNPVTRNRFQRRVRIV